MVEAKRETHFRLALAFGFAASIALRVITFGSRTSAWNEFPSSNKKKESQAISRSRTAFLSLILSERTTRNMVL